MRGLALTMSRHCLGNQVAEPVTSGFNTTSPHSDRQVIPGIAVSFLLCWAVHGREVLGVGFFWGGVVSSSASGPYVPVG